MHVGMHVDGSYGGLSCACRNACWWLIWWSELCMQECLLVVRVVV